MSEEKNVLKKAIETFKQGQPKKAVSVLEEASRVYPESYEAFVYLGAAYASINRYNAAIGAFKRASEMKPDSPKIHYNLGQAYEAAGVPKEAWLEYKNAVSLDPDYHLAKTAMSSLSVRLKDLVTPAIEFDN